MATNYPRGIENVCEPAVKYKFMKKFGVWCRTWFTIEVDGGNHFVQHNAFHKDRNADWNKWATKPVVK